MTMLAGYFDESGTRDAHAVIVSGFVSTVDKFVKFERDWKHVHADFQLPDPTKHPFHMKDFAHSNGVFKHWKGEEDRRRDFIDRLINIIKIRVEFGFTFGIEIEAYKAVNKIFPLEERSVAPYALCAAGCMHKSTSWARSQDRKLKHVFADGAMDKGKFMDLVGKPYPIFGTMDEYLPCQAADLSAYEALRFRKDFDAYNSGRRPVRGSLAALYTSVPGQHMIADQASLINLCETWSLSRRENDALPSKQ